MKIPLISRLLERREGFDSANPKLYTIINSGPTHAGVVVNETSAMKIVAVYACVDLLSSTIGSLPLILYRRLQRGKERATELPMYKLLHDKPNTEQNSDVWRQEMMAHTLLWGHSYSEIQFNKKGESEALWPLPPWRIQQGRTESKALFYRVTLPDGNIKNIPGYAMLHIQALMGLSPIRQAMEALGLARAAEEFGGRLFGQGANLGGVVTHPGTLKKEGHDKLETSLNESYTGLGKSHRIMLLEEGMKWEKVGIPPNEAQFLETRKFQRGEIASLFRVPPHLIGDLEHATFSNIEHQAIEFVIYTLRRWLVSWEQEIKNKLIYQDDLFAEFLVDGLLRGDTLSRYQAYATGRQNGWLSANDIRELENMNPLPDEQGDIYLVPLNMQPVGWLGSGNQGDGTQGSESMAKRSRELRRGLTITRFRTARAYRRVFESTAERIVDEEVKKVKRAIKQNLTSRSADDFKGWIADYYRDFAQFIIRQLAPIALSLADAITPIAKEQMNGNGEINTQKLVDEYVNSYAVRHIASSTGQINALLKEEKAAELLEERLDEWRAKRPAKISMNETIQLSNFIAKEMFAAGGAAMLIWVNTSGNPCPFCQEMDGRTVGIDQHFVGAGQKLDSEGKSPMTIYRPTSQPPLHEGCECTLEPG
jgi:HK97 family phage portal protein